MLTKKQIKGIIYCGIAFLSLIFALICFFGYAEVYGLMFILATLTYTTIGLFDLLVFPEDQRKRAPQAPRQNFNPQNGYPQNGYPQNGYPQNGYPQNQPPQNNNYNNPNQ